MSVLSAQTIRRLGLVHPLVERTEIEICERKFTFGLGPCGYDVRIDQNLFLAKHSFKLASTVEQFNMPNNVVGYVKDKSSWARRGLLVQNTVLEPNWKGYLTLELTNDSDRHIDLLEGMPIAQVIFHFLDEPTTILYDGKYQNQPRGPQEAK